MKLKTKFTEQFQLEYPIVCAPMFLVSTVNLVLAASKAGGIGAFPALNYRPIEKYAEALQQIKKESSKPFAVNLIVQASNRYLEQQLELTLEAKTPLIITSLGKPDKVIEKAHAAGAKVYCDVINLEHAKKVIDLGADGLIAVSYGAGGHAGNISPFVLIPSLADKFDVPVLAAGGITDARAMAAALDLGASGVYMGTRFIASKECEVAEEYKQAILQAGCAEVINTDRVDGYPGNFLKTPALEALGLEESLFECLLKKNARFRKTLAIKRSLKSLFGHDKKVSYKTVFAAGQCVELIHELKSVEEIMKDIMREYAELKEKMSTF